MTEPRLSLVAALSRNDVIGRDNALLWHLPADMVHFKKLTSGHVVIMGRKTYQSLPPRFRPLPNRLNIVLTRNPSDNVTDDLIWVTSLDDALALGCKAAAARQQDEYFVIGGGEIYAQCLPRADTLYLTHVDAHYDGDAFFPAAYKNMNWHETILSEHAAANGQPSFRIVRHKRKGL